MPVVRFDVNHGNILVVIFDSAFTFLNKSIVRQHREWKRNDLTVAGDRVVFFTTSAERSIALLGETDASRSVQGTT